MPRKKPPRRRRDDGRPPEDRRDQIIVDLAAAIQATTKLGPQRARDYALAFAEGYLVTPELVPLRPRPGVPATFQVPKLLVTKGKPGWTQASLEIDKTLEARGRTIRKKAHAGMVPRPEVVKGLIALLCRSEDPEALIRVTLQLIGLLRAGHI